MNVVKNISSIRKLCHKVRTPAKTFFTHGIKMIKNRLKMPNFAGASTLSATVNNWILAVGVFIATLFGESPSNCPRAIQNSLRLGIWARNLSHPYWWLTSTIWMSNSASALCPYVRHAYGKLVFFLPL